MADTTVGIRLSMSGQRQAVSGINSVNTALENTSSKLGKVAGAAGNAAASIAGFAGNKVMGAVRSVTSVITGVATAATATVSAMAISLVKAGIGYNDLEQRSRAAFTTILGGAEAADKMMADIREFGRSSPFPRQAFISATQQLLGFGYQAEEIIPLLKTINDSTAAIGGNSDTIATLTDVFATIRSNGKVGTEDLNRMAEVGINGFQALADATGQSMEDVRKSIQAGSIDATKGVTILTDFMNKRFAGASDNVKKTWSGATDRVKGAFRDLGSALADPFVSTKGGGLAITWANNLADGMRKAANAAPLLMDLLRSGKVDGPALEKILGPTAGAKLTETFQNLRTAALQIVRAFGFVKVNVDASGTALDLVLATSRRILAVVNWLTTSYAAFLAGFNSPGSVDSGANPIVQFGAVAGHTIDQLQTAWDLFTLGFKNSGYITDASNSWVQFGAKVKGWIDTIAGTWHLFVLGFQNSGDVTGASSLWVQLGAAISSGFDQLRSFDWTNITGSLGSIGGSLRDLVPAWQAFHQAMPDLAVVGGAVGDALQIVAAVLQVLASHVDWMVEHAGLLVGIFVAWKAAQYIVAASVAVTNARMIIGTTVTLANMAAMKQHTISLWANATAMSGKTRAELEAEVAGKKTLVQAIRARIATAASTVAQKAAAVATRIFAAAQWLLNKAIGANPIVKAITVLILLAGLFVLLYKRSETFRNIVNTLWHGIQVGAAAAWGFIKGVLWPGFKAFVLYTIGNFVELWHGIQAAWGGIVAGAQWVWNWIKDNWPKLLGIITGPIGMAVIYAIQHWDAIKAGAQSLWDKVKDVAGGFKDFAENTIRRVVGGAIDFARDKVNGIRDRFLAIRDTIKELVDWFGKMADKIKALPGVQGVIDAAKSIIPGLAKGGTLYSGQPTLVGEKGPELILPQANGEVIPNSRLAQLSQTDSSDLQALAGAGSATQVIQLVVDRKVLAQTTVGGLNATNARR